MFLVGCSASSGGSTGLRIGLNLSRKDSNLKLFLDGQEAVQSKLKKGLTGYSPFKIKEPVGTSPVFKYEIIDPKKFGYIKNVSMQVHQKFEPTSPIFPTYIIHPVDKEHNMKPAWITTWPSSGQTSGSWTAMTRPSKRSNSSPAPNISWCSPCPPTRASRSRSTSRPSSRWSRTYPRIPVAPGFQPVCRAGYESLPQSWNRLQRIVSNDSVCHCS